MSIFHTTFVGKSYDTADAIKVLQQFQVTASQLVEGPEQQPVIEEQHPVPDQKEPVNKHNAFFPDKKDTLFWSIYIGLNGITEYEKIHRGYGNVEIC